MLIVLASTNKLYNQRVTPKQNVLFENRQSISGAREIKQDDVSTLTSFPERSTNRKAKVHQDLKRRLPECLIIGVMKAGTDALLSYLKIHPRLAVHPVEARFFDVDANYAKGLEHYRTQMPYSYPDQITIEKTPYYFTTDSVPKRIKQFNKNIKLIVTLRNPVTRVISHFAHFKSHGKIGQNATLDDFLTSFKGRTGDHPVIHSMYHTHMMRLLEYFNRKQIHVVDGDNLIVNPIEEMDKIETFLGIKHIITKDKVYFNKTKGFYCIVDKKRAHPCLGRAKGRDHPAIDQKLSKILKDFFDIYNKALFALLRRSFNWD